MKKTVPVRIKLTLTIEDAAQSGQFAALARQFEARSFIRGSAYRVVEQYPVVIEAMVTRKHETELAKLSYVESVTRTARSSPPMKARETFYRAHMRDYVSP